MNEETIDTTKTSKAILDVCNNYMIKNKSTVAQQEVIWGLVDNLSILIAISQPPDWVMKAILSAVSSAYERDVSGYDIVDPRELQ